MTLIPGLLMSAMAFVYLISEWRIRRETNWTQGPLNGLTMRIAVIPLAVYAAGALIFSAGGWAVLSLTSFLVVAALPMALAGAVRWSQTSQSAEFAQRSSLAPLVALTLSLLGLTSVVLGQ